MNYNCVFGLGQNLDHWQHKVFVLPLLFLMLSQTLKRNPRWAVWRLQICVSEHRIKRWCVRLPRHLTNTLSAEQTGFAAMQMIFYTDMTTEPPCKHCGAVHTPAASGLTSVLWIPAIKKQILHSQLTEQMRSCFARLHLDQWKLCCPMRRSRQLMASVLAPRFGENRRKLFKEELWHTKCDKAQGQNKQRTPHTVNYKLIKLRRSLRWLLSAAGIHAVLDLGCFYLFQSLTWWQRKFSIQVSLPE